VTAFEDLLFVKMVRGDDDDDDDDDDGPARAFVYINIFSFRFPSRERTGGCRSRRTIERKDFGFRVSVPRAVVLDRRPRLMLMLTWTVDARRDGLGVRSHGWGDGG